MRLKSGERNIAVVVETPYSAAGIVPDQALYGHLKPGQARLITDLFKHDLITHGYFNDMYHGDKELVGVALDASHVDYLIRFNPGAVELPFS